MNIRDVRFVGNSYVHLQDLNEGDLFIEDTYPEVYRVEKIRAPTQEEFDSGIRFKMYECRDLTDDRLVTMFGDAGALVRVEPK